MFDKLIRYFTLILGIYLFGTGIAFADEGNTKLIAKAKSAAPASLSDNATVIINGNVTVKGSNGWICMPDTMPSDGMPMCNDALWMKMLV